MGESINEMADVLWEFKEKRHEIIIEGIKERLDANSQMAGEIAAGAWRTILSGPAHSQPGMPPGMESGDLAKSLDVRTYAGRRGYSGFIVKPRSKKMQSILGRLSRGYYGTDKAGRKYHEPARPSAAKALAASRAAVLEAMIRGR